jgi:hypothetical protein
VSFQNSRKGTVAEQWGQLLDLKWVNERETFGLPGNRIELPLLEIDEGTAYDFPQGVVGHRNVVAVIANLACLGASNGRCEAGGDLPASQGL